MADNDVNGIRRLMAQARRDGLSLSGIMHRLEQAVNGKYSSKGFSEDEFDLAILEGLRGVNNKYHPRQIAIICGWVLHVAKVIPPP